MTTKTRNKSFLSERIWPVVRAILLQAFLMLNIVGNLAAWGVFVLVVDKLQWMQIDYSGKTIEEVSTAGKNLGLSVVFLVNLLIVLLVWRFIERKRLRDMWLGFQKGWGRALLLGLSAGLGEVVIVFLGMVIFGVVDASWGWNPTNTKAIGLALGWVIPSSILAPLVEEILNRGYWFQNIKRGWGIWVATIVTALLFGGLHLANADAEILGAVNIALGAVAWVLGMLLTGSLWFSIGWHAGWNFFQFFLTGLPNSGISVADMGLEGTTLFVSELSGPRILTGGAFGMEASLVDTVVLTIAIVILFTLWRRKQVKNHTVNST